MSTVIVRQESMSNEISQINNAMKWFNKELTCMKVMVSEVLKAVGPKYPTPQEREPSGPSEDNAGPSGCHQGIQLMLKQGRQGLQLLLQQGHQGQGSGPEKETLNPVEPDDLVGSQGVVFPSVVKEDLVRDPGCCSSLLLKEDQLSWVLYCP
ncbi:hypothetical protein Taro_030794 [Colocasia esculenta]|uniref:Uncharacterized protein n=1 Tax=Colocasia esculenta TaxID=4460 RepID=A0A843VQ39_COLES|nr:hypothetical protein [Colocasia esculenta]